MEALRVTKPLTIGDVTLIAIERFEIHSDMSVAGYWLSGFKEAYAVVVCDASGIRALDVDSAEIELDVLVQKISNLGSLISELSMS